MSQVWLKPTFSPSTAPFSLFSSRSNHSPEAWAYRSYPCFTLSLCMVMSVKMCCSPERFKSCHTSFCNLLFFPNQQSLILIFIHVDAGSPRRFIFTSRQSSDGGNATAYLPTLLLGEHLGPLSYCKQFCRECGRLHSETPRFTGPCDHTPCRVTAVASIGVYFSVWLHDWLWAVGCQQA